MVLECFCFGVMKRCRGVGLVWVPKMLCSKRSMGRLKSWCAHTYTPHTLTHTHTHSQACTYHSVTLSLLCRLTSIKQIRSKSKSELWETDWKEEEGLVQQNTARITTLIKINDLQLAAHLQSYYTQF